MNFLFCSVGRRGELIKNFKQSLPKDSQIIATDYSNNAPALYFADKQYTVPKVTALNYVDVLLNICDKEKIRAVTTFIDPEIEVLSRNRHLFEDVGVEVLAPYLETAEICFDKFKFYEHLVANNIPTVPTYDNFDDLHKSHRDGKIEFPVFVKPRTGSGSVGARSIASMEELKAACDNDSTLIIQRLMHGEDLDVDVYVDTISGQAVSAFSKRKLETKIGGANKTISFKDGKLFELITRTLSKFRFNGPIDMDYFYIDGEYYLSEINPRFGGAYLHAYGCGVDFIELMVNNLNGKENTPVFGNYDDDVLMMMYDSVVIKKESELAKEVN